jgi:hypothetical protein
LLGTFLQSILPPFNIRGKPQTTTSAKAPKESPDAAPAQSPTHVRPRTAGRHSVDQPPTCPPAQRVCVCASLEGEPDQRTPPTHGGRYLLPAHMQLPTLPPHPVTIRACSVLDPPLIPLRFRSARVHAAPASVCWRSQSTVDSLFFIDVPINQGPRSFCAWPALMPLDPVHQPILDCSKPGLPKSTNPYPESQDPEFLDPGMSPLTAPTPHLRTPHAGTARTHPHPACSQKVPGN